MAGPPVTNVRKKRKERDMVKYNKEERLRIGKEIFDRDLSCMDAAVKYDINFYTARDYFRYYKAYIKADELGVKRSRKLKTFAPAS